MRALSWREDHSRRGNDTRARRMHQLPHAARPWKRSRGMRRVPCRCPRGPRKRGSVRLLPPAPHRRSAPDHIDLHQLSYEGRRSRHWCPRGRHRVRRVPQAACLRAARGKNAMCFVPRAGDDPRGVEPWARGVRFVSRSIGRARSHESARLRHLSREGAGERARGPSALSGVPRPARGSAHAHVRHVPQERDNRNPRGGGRRVRDLPSSARSGGNRGAPILYELPRGGDPAGSARGARPRGL